MDFTIVVASDPQGTIGNNGTLPWRVPTDMKFFRQLTLGIVDSFREFKNDSSNINNPTSMTKNSDAYANASASASAAKKNAIIMGRVTADSLKSPLPRRVNCVVTSNNDYRPDEDFECFTGLFDALKYCASRDDIDKVFVIGGSKLYDTAIKSNYCTRIIHTELEKNYEGDTALSETWTDALSEFDIASVSKHVCVSSNVGFTVRTYEYHNTEEMAYLELGRKILDTGDRRQTRNAITYSLFGEKLIFNITENPDHSFTLPMLTTKTLFARGVAEELFFFMRGDTDTHKLEQAGVAIWKGNTNAKFLKDNSKDLQEGEMGPMYGFIWRHFGTTYRGGSQDYTGEGVDQITNCVNELVNNPHSRRILMTAYNPEQAEQGVLYPCHGLMVQFYVENGKISLQMYQRSADYFLGLPFNITSYALLLCLIVMLVNAKLENEGSDLKYSTGRVIMVLGDVHIYSDEKGDHVQAVRDQLERHTYRFPQIRFCKEIRTLDDFTNMCGKDIRVTNYAHHPSIRVDMVA